jgi:hypothetical protein
MEGNDEIQLFGSWARATQLPMLSKLPARVRPVNIRAHSLEVVVEDEAAPVLSGAIFNHSETWNAVLRYA